MTNAPRQTIRLDKWLWHARFFKSRSLAAGVVSGGKVRVDGTPVSKPARAVGAGDVLTFVQADTARVVKVLACGERRGPAPEAQALYEDLTPATKPRPVQARGPNPRYEGGGRPTKKDRRDMRLD
ncbi:RNA-binding S4 domain-containing protein [Yoonia sediminilitoris]|uniref:Heat shock protein Hsp15 n=1 Tax=Yoonia sediminilitoris TaxID=1286148 RepID=A0A2T6KQI0_9RHOB|nr:RNA-binding S4 domain-containing protein [Yoonia sediminilitoris]PUB18816.1 heat shock protein Hsp15 [Yoonia sediminilitoris]RCW98984.1 heat shock protein Hsp15 [Yoonia sediminilitoris]